LKDDQLVSVLQIVEDVFNGGAVDYRISVGFSGILRKIA
jgi:hypothetical protein